MKSCAFSKTQKESQKVECQLLQHVWPLASGVPMTIHQTRSSPDDPPLSSFQSESDSFVTFLWEVVSSNQDIFKRQSLPGGSQIPKDAALSTCPELLGVPSHTPITAHPRHSCFIFFNAGHPTFFFFFCTDRTPAFSSRPLKGIRCRA